MRRRGIRWLATMILAAATAARADTLVPATPANPARAASHVPSLDPRRFDIAIDDAPSRGDASAPVTLVEFADFECPFCARSVAWVDSIARAWPHGVRVVFLHDPLPAHAHAELAAEAACAADAQGAFWKMHDRMYAWSGPLDRDALMALAAEAGLDVPAFAAALVTHRYRLRVQRDVDEGKRVGVDGTPTFFLNGRQYLGVGVRTMSAVRPFIEAELAAGRDAR